MSDIIIGGPDNLVPAPWQAPIGKVTVKLPDGSTAKGDVDLTEAWLWFFQSLRAFAGSDQFEIDVALTLALEAAANSKARQQIVSDPSGSSMLRQFALRIAGLESQLAGLAAVPTVKPQLAAGPAADLGVLAFATAVRRQPPLSPQIVFCTQATFPVLANLPGPTLIIVTDYGHSIYWDGTTPVFVDGGNCFIALFDIDPGAGWHLLDGTANVPYLKADGTLGTYTVENATTAFFLEAGLANSGPTAAVAPGLTMNPYTPSGNVSSVFTGTAIPLTNSTLFAVTGATTGITSVGGSITTFTPAGTIVSVFAGIAVAPTGSVDATGEPRKLVRRAYFRQ